MLLSILEHIKMRPILAILPVLVHETSGKNLWQKYFFHCCLAGFGLREQLSVAYAGIVVLLIAFVAYLRYTRFNNFARERKLDVTKVETTIVEVVLLFLFLTSLDDQGIKTNMLSFQKNRKERHQEKMAMIAHAKARGARRSVELQGTQHLLKKAKEEDTSFKKAKEVRCILLLTQLNHHSAEQSCTVVQLELRRFFNRLWTLVYSAKALFAVSTFNL